jgi:hypothetical protein
MVLLPVQPTPEHRPQRHLRDVRERRRIAGLNISVDSYASGCKLPTMNADGARQLFEKAIRKAGGVRKLARKLGCSAPYVSDIRLGRRGLSRRILDFLGLTVERSVKYRRYRRVRPEGKTR